MFLSILVIMEHLWICCDISQNLSLVNDQCESSVLPGLTGLNYGPCSCTSLKYDSNAVNLIQ